MVSTVKWKTSVQNVSPILGTGVVASYAPQAAFLNKKYLCHLTSCHAVCHSQTPYPPCALPSSTSSILQPRCHNRLPYVSLLSSGMASKTQSFMDARSVAWRVPSPCRNRRKSGCIITKHAYSAQ